MASDTQASQEELLPRRGVEGYALWIGLILGLSPVLKNLLDHWIVNPWSRYSLAFIVLLILAAKRDLAAKPLRWQGLLLIAAAMLGEIVALRAAMVPLARPFAAMAIVGMLLLRGTSSRRTALLALWIIPVPWTAIVELGGLVSVTSLYRAAAFLLSPLGTAFEMQGPILSAGSVQVPVALHQSGLMLLVHMSGLAWYSSQRRGLPWAATGRVLMGYALLAGPIQLGSIVAILLLLHCGAPAWISRLVDVGAWLVPFLVVVLRERRDVAIPSSRFMSV